MKQQTARVGRFCWFLRKGRQFIFDPTGLEKWFIGKFGEVLFRYLPASALDIARRISLWDYVIILLLPPTFQAFLRRGVGKLTEERERERENPPGGRVYESAGDAG